MMAGWKKVSEVCRCAWKSDLLLVNEVRMNEVLTRSGMDVVKNLLQAES